MVTVYENMYSERFFHVELSVALNRIKSGKSVEAVKSVQNSKTKEESSEAKKNLPCVCFSGKFGSKHNDSSLQEHSGVMVLDFDHVEDVESTKKELCEWEYTNACWISPSGKGIKVLVKIADGAKHRDHFAAIKEEQPDIDPSGVNVARLCFESYDPNLYFNNESKVWTKTVKVETSYSVVHPDDREIFDKLLVWMGNKGKAFQSGERNQFVFTIATACCKFGITEERAISLISLYVSSDSNFSQKETKLAIRSAYRKNLSQFNSAEFDKGNFVDKTTRKNISVKMSHEEIRELNKQNVIYGEDAKDDVMDIYLNGYKKVHGIDVPDIDKHYKRKTGEVTCFTGFGNMGKSTYWYWYLMMRAIIFDERAAIFGPESGSAADFYFDLTEMFIGHSCVLGSRERPDQETFEAAYNFVIAHFFYVSPSELSPTPEVIKETFLGLIIGKNVKSVVIDPFNQLANNYSEAGGRSDKYLETFLADCSRFAKINDVNFDIIAHPKTPSSNTKDSAGDYPCPDQFSISDGSMWNNKTDNILVYHRPFGFSAPTAGDCEVHSKKIRKQKVVGEKGEVVLYYNRASRRFLVREIDYMAEAISKHIHGKKTETIKPNVNFFASSQDIKEKDIFEDVPF